MADKPNINISLKDLKPKVNVSLNNLKKSGEEHDLIKSFNYGVRETANDFENFALNLSKEKYNADRVNELNKLISDFEKQNIDIYDENNKYLVDEYNSNKAELARLNILKNKPNYFKDLAIKDREKYDNYFKNDSTLGKVFGVAGNLLGDPFTYLPIPALGGKITKKGLLKLAGAGAGIGGASSLIHDEAYNDNGSLTPKERIEGAIIGAGAGAVGFPAFSLLLRGVGKGAKKIFNKNKIEEVIPDEIIVPKESIAFNPKETKIKEAYTQYEEGKINEDELNKILSEITGKEIKVEKVPEEVVIPEENIIPKEDIIPEEKILNEQKEFVGAPTREQYLKNEAEALRAQKEKEFFDNTLVYEEGMSRPMTRKEIAETKARYDYEMNGATYPRPAEEINAKILSDDVNNVLNKSDTTLNEANSLLKDVKNVFVDMEKEKALTKQNIKLNNDNVLKNIINKGSVKRRDINYENDLEKTIRDTINRGNSRTRDIGDIPFNVEEGVNIFPNVKGATPELSRRVIDLQPRNNLHKEVMYKYGSQAEDDFEKYMGKNMELKNLPRTPAEYYVANVADFTDDIVLKKELRQAINKGEVTAEVLEKAVKENESLLNHFDRLGREKSALEHEISQMEKDIDELLAWHESNVKSNSQRNLKSKNIYPVGLKSNTSMNALALGGTGGVSYGEEYDSWKGSISRVAGVGALALAGYKGRHQLAKLPFIKNIVRDLKDSDSGLRKGLDTAGQFLYNKKLKENKPYMENLEAYYRAESEVASTIEKLNRALSSLSLSERKVLHHAMVNEGHYRNIPPYIMRVADMFRDSIDSLSDEIVDLGILEQETIDVWKGGYLRRLYDKHFSLDGEVRKEVRSKTVQDVKERGKKVKMTVSQIKDLESKHMIGDNIRGGKYVIEDMDAYNRALNEGNFNKKIKVRRDWTYDERTAMGEIRDAAVTIPYTMYQLKSMINSAIFLKEVEATGIGRKIMRYIDGKIEILPLRKGEDKLIGKQYGALNGFAVPKYIAEDIKIQTRLLNEEETALGSLWRDFLSLWKRSKTVYNLPSHMNNTVGNMSLMVSQGVPVRQAILKTLKSYSSISKYNRVMDLKGKQMFGKATQQEIDELNNLLKQPDVLLVQEATDNGLFGGANIEELLRGVSNKKDLGFFGRQLKKVQDLYIREDNMARVAYYDYLRNTAKLDAKEAVIKSRNIIPDYRMPMSKAGRFARDSGLVPFMSWTYHTMPAILKSINPFGKNEFGKGLSKYNAFNLLKVIGFLWGIGTVSSLAQGGGIVTPMFIPTEKPRNMQFTTQEMLNDGHNKTFMRTNYMFPQLGALASSLGIPYNWLVEGKFKGLEDLGDTFKSYITGGLIGNVIGAAVNRDPYTGFQISNQEGVNRALDELGYFGDKLAPVPPMMSRLMQSGIQNTSRDDNDKVIKNPTVAKTLLNIFLPRLYDVDVNRYHFSEKEKDNINKKNYGFSGVLGDFIDKVFKGDKR